MLDNLALLYVHTGAYAKAEPLYQRSLAIEGKRLAQTIRHCDHARQSRRIYRAQVPTPRPSRCSSARSRSEKAPGPNHPATATALNNRFAPFETGAYAKAAPLFQRRSRSLRKH
jgi:hypothetical protein